MELKELLAFCDAFFSAAKMPRVAAFVGTATSFFAVEAALDGFTFGEGRKLLTDDQIAHLQVLKAIALNGCDSHDRDRTRHAYGVRGLAQFCHAWQLALD